MKKIILFLTLFMTTLFGEDYLDLSIETKTNYRFEDYFFEDINKTQKLEKELNFPELKASGNFNSIIGFNYSKNMIVKPDSYETKEIYIGSDKTKFLGYQKDDTSIEYGSRTINTETTKYTIYDILTIEQTTQRSTATETFLSPESETATITDTVYRKNSYEKYILSSENLYNSIKEDAIAGEDYFYGVAGALNAKSMFRLYGVVIASYEQHDFSDGEANFYTTDENGTEVFQSIYRSTADVKRINQQAESGKFKGFGYGYKITAEAYWKDFSMFLTSYMKKTKLKNYHTDVRDAEANAEPVANLIADDTINYLQRYTSFGLRYRF